jgi:hypothetical protein
MERRGSVFPEILDIHPVSAPPVTLQEPPLIQLQVSNPAKKKKETNQLRASPPYFRQAATHGLPGSEPTAALASLAAARAAAAELL